MPKVRTIIEPLTCGQTAAKWGMKDTNDCVVRALVNASDGSINYPEAHSELKAAGRIDGEGTPVRVFDKVFRNHGFTPVAVIGKTIMAGYYNHYFNGSVPHIQEGCTLARLLKSAAVKNGRFVVITDSGKHAIAVIDGEVIDTYRNKGAASVVLVYKAEE